ncbi:hypothetical protein [Sanguibacter sp. 25GB23B1]
MTKMILQDEISPMLAVRGFERSKKGLPTVVEQWDRHDRVAES